MNNVLGLVIFALGIVLLIIGFGASQPVGADPAPAPASSIWLLIGGALSVLSGLSLALRSVRR